MTRLQTGPTNRTALLIVDMQNYFFQKAERRINLDRVIENINLASRACDQAGFPVVHVITAYRADRTDWDIKMLASGIPELVEKSPEVAILPGIEIRDQHLHLTKTRYSAFFKTDLEQILRNQEINRVITCGAYTHYCVNATVFDAYCHDFVPGILVDAVMSHLEEEAKAMLARMDRNGYHLLTTQEFVSDCMQILEGGG